METMDALTGQMSEPEANESTETQNPDQGFQDSSSMESLLEEQGLSLVTPNQGEILQGVIATIRESEILVSIGTKSEGVISGREMEQIPVEDRATFFIGKEIPVYVIMPEDSNGNVVLSYIRAREQKDWEIVDELLASGDAYPSKVIGFNKGGLIVPVGGLRGFVPASQVSMTRRVSAGNETPEQRWSKMIGEAMDVRVIEVDRERRRLILSERMALQETRETLKDRLLDELQEGSTRKGRVTSLADFGAFVNIDGADGLVHLSEISWDRIQHPNEVLKVGQEVDVKVISVDRERKRIGLSIRQLQEDPWMHQVGHLKEGMLVEGKITHLTKFGAFARLEGDLEGLIHVSELSEQRIAHPKEVLHEGDTITLRIIKIDPERHRIGLSRRKVDSPAYADLDWKMALADEVGKASETEENAPTADAPTADTPTADEPAATTEENHGRGNLEYVEGIGPAYAEKFHAIGIQTTDELLEAGATASGRGDLAEKTAISPSLILTWINHCDLFRINGVGSQYADLLEAAGVDTVVELAQRNAENLYEKLVTVNEEKNLVRKLPVQSHVEDWVQQAKDLPRVITY